MKSATNIFLSAIMLTLMLLGVSGVSVEKCSCTGRIALTIPVDMGCCPGENGCMTVKTIQLSDYVPSITAHVDMPHQPVLFVLFTHLAPVQSTLPQWKQESFFADAPPGALAHTGGSVLLC